MYHDYSQEELRAYCRSSIESLEIWARRLIHEKMAENYGKNYINATDNNGEWIIKKDIRKHVFQMIDKKPLRFSKAVDTLFLEHIIYFLCNPKWYNSMFKPAMDYAFPQGCEELREFLKRLIPIRNALSHANPISVRQAEQALCYSHDFVEGLLAYYKEVGEERMWNVPRIIRVTDSRGNEFLPPMDSVASFTKRITPEFYVKDSYSIEIEVDPAFSPDDYTICWAKLGNSYIKYPHNSKHLFVTFSDDDIGQSMIIKCDIVSKKNWHRFFDSDDTLQLIVTVLPLNN